MKFGKRLAAEASRREDWVDHFLDYKALKKAVKNDISANGKRQRTGTTSTQESRPFKQCFFIAIVATISYDHKT